MRKISWIVSLFLIALSPGVQPAWGLVSEDAPVAAEADDEEGDEEDEEEGGW